MQVKGDNVFKILT